MGKILIGERAHRKLKLAAGASGYTIEKFVDAITGEQGETGRRVALNSLHQVEKLVPKPKEG